MKLALSAMFSVLFSTSILAQDIEDDIKQIRKWYGEVESKMKECQKMNLEDYTQLEDIDGPMEVLAYYHPATDKFLKIEFRVFADWHEEVSQYYLNNEQLFFEYTTGNSADEMYTAEELNITEQEFWERGGEAKTISYSQYRTYYKDGEVIRFLSKFKTVKSEDPAPDFSKMENVTEAVNDANGAPNIEAILTQFRKQLK